MPPQPRSTEEEVAWLKRRVAALEAQVADVMLELTRNRRSQSSIATSCRPLSRRSDAG